MIAHCPPPWLAWLILAGLVLAGAETAGRCGQAEPATAAFKIGLVLPPSEPEGETIGYGAQLGAEWVRAAGRNVELIARGSSGQWGTEGDDAVALALDAATPALIAPTTGATVHLVEQVAGRTRIPTVVLCGDTSVTGARLPWVLRLVPDNVQEARTLLAGVPAAAERSVPHWAALVPEGRAGREAAKDLGEAAASAGGGLQLVLPVSANPTNASATLERLTRSAPPGLLVWLDPAAAGRWVRALRASGYRGVMAGPGRLAGPTFLREAGPAAEGFFSTRPATPETNRARAAEFGAAYTDRFGVGPDPMALAAADAVQVLAWVLHEAGERPAFTLLPLRQPLDGLTGRLEFDAVGNRRVELELLVVREGRFCVAGGGTLTAQPLSPAR